MPEGLSWVQVGVPPKPLAFDKIQTSLKFVEKQLFPPKTIISLVPGSYTAERRSLGDGGPPLGLSCIHAGVPATPAAWFSTQTSLAHGEACPRPPPKIVILSLTESYTADCPALGAGRVPVGLACTQPKPGPSGLTSHQTSFKSGLLELSLVPPKMIILPELGSNTAEKVSRATGPFSCVHDWAAAVWVNTNRPTQLANASAHTLLRLHGNPPGIKFRDPPRSGSDPGFVRRSDYNEVTTTLSSYFGCL